MTIRFPRTQAERPKKVVDVLQIVQAASAEVSKRRPIDDDWRRSFIDAEPTDPLLVLGPVRSNRDYFIVDFRNQKKSTARIIYRAADGKLAEIAGLTSGQSQLSPLLRPFELPDVIRERSISYPGGATVPFDMNNLSLDRDLVWAPCDQSRSPMQPFYVVHMGKTEVYVRVDGAAFGELTEFVAGG